MPNVPSPKVPKTPFCGVTPIRRALAFIRLSISPPSASCSGNYAKQRHDRGQTLKLLTDHLEALSELSQLSSVKNSIVFSDGL